MNASAWADLCRRLRSPLSVRVRASVGDVFPDGPVQQQHMLGHQTDLAAQAGDAHAADVGPVDDNAARVRVCEAHQQVDDGALARAVLPRDGDGLPRLNLQIDAREDLLPSRIGEVHILQANMAGNGGEGGLPASSGSGCTAKASSSRAAAPRAVCTLP